MNCTPCAGELVLDAGQLHKAYQRGPERLAVLQGATLQARRGECVFLVGPSGSGKSSLLAILGCLLRPDAGEVTLLGQRVSVGDGRQQTAFRRQLVGFVFQRFHLIRGLTALENVCVPLMLQGIDESRAIDRGQEMLRRVGLAECFKADPRRMSAGQCQRVAIARALVTDPPLILADEPTASLDEASGRQVMELFARLVHEQGKTAIVVTHDPRTFPFADRILHLERGRLNEEPASQPQPSLSAAR